MQYVMHYNWFSNVDMKKVKPSVLMQPFHYLFIVTLTYTFNISP